MLAVSRTACLVMKRSRADSNRCERFCRPPPSHSATRPYYKARCWFANVLVLALALLVVYNDGFYLARRCNHYFKICYQNTLYGILRQQVNRYLAFVFRFIVRCGFRLRFFCFVRRRSIIFGLGRFFLFRCTSFLLVFLHLFFKIRKSRQIS